MNGLVYGSRWATFDCYGTLVDWNRGIGDELERLFGAESRDAALARYHELEPEIEAQSPGAPYRDVLADTLAGVAESLGRDLLADEQNALGRSLPTWPVFEEVPPALAELRSRGWRLAILSNTDRDFIEASMERIGVPFELAIVASEIGSYKPRPGHWRDFTGPLGRTRRATPTWRRASITTSSPVTSWESRVYGSTGWGRRRRESPRPSCRT